MSSRSEKSIRNIYYALIGQAFGLVITFVARMIFIQELGVDYLGINSLFTNVLTVLSLAELGVGEAIIYSLYKPLALNDKEQCARLMGFYKRAYYCIGTTIFLLGILLLPFLNFIVNENNNVDNVEVIFLLFVINSSISYFLSYKRNLIIADQLKYIVTYYKYLFYFILNLSQIVFLVVTRNYIVFLILQILSTVLENYFIAVKADKLYPFLRDKKVEGISNECKKEIIKNTKAMMMHKVGGIVIFSTDNIILSKFVSLNSVGIYANYFLITNSLFIIISQVYSSITASVGNLCSTCDDKTQYLVFKRIDFFGFWIFSSTAVCLFSLLNPFINLWLGEAYLFSREIVFIIVINYYILGVRKAVLTFREAAGLFYRDRWKSIVEALFKIFFSILLVKEYSTLGVFLATIISSLSFSVWIEAYILHKYAFYANIREYVFTYCKRVFILLGMGSVVSCFSTMIGSRSIEMFILNSLASFIFSNAILVVLFCRNAEFHYFVRKILKRLG